MRQIRINNTHTLYYTIILESKNKGRSKLDAATVRNRTTEVSVVDNSLSKHDIILKHVWKCSKEIT